MFTEEEKWAITLSTFAGLSTTIGAIFAVLRRPDDGLLAFLLGTAIGVMLVLSLVEMWLRNAYEHGWPGVTASVLCGALLYQLAQPFLPDFRPSDLVAAADSGTSSGVALTQRGNNDEDTGSSAKHSPTSAPTTRQGSSGGGSAGGSGSGSATQAGLVTRRQEQSIDRDTDSARIARAAKAKDKARSSELLRLGLLMAFTMTLHNLPEGFAVGFSALTDFGPVMAMAIAVHNIPEGIIVAAPVYAATGSRWKALAIATLSGLSEPLGATLALLVLKPFLTEERLQYMLAFVGGIMAAVCVLELWPEGRKCKDDRRLVAGIAVGGAIMAWTLWVGV